MLTVFPRPKTKEELYNLRHAMLRNVVERCIGVLKWRWGILPRPPSYDMDIQTFIPLAACALHNFILRYDPDEREGFDDVIDMQPGIHAGDEGELAQGNPNREEVRRANSKRDLVAQQMWDDYLALVAEREGANNAA